MVEITLPKNSKIAKGKQWPAPAGAKQASEFKVYRYNPDAKANPIVDAYTDDLADCGPLALGGLDRIKKKTAATPTVRQS